MTPFDFIAALLLLVSGVTGFVRGAVREMVTVVGFVAAACLAIFGLRYSGPVFRGMFNPDWLGTALAIVVVFGVIYILFRLVGAAVTKKLHGNGALGLADRTIGLGFGLLRAFVILGVFNLLFAAALMGERAPEWTQRSKLFPLSEASARVLKVFAPKGSNVAGALRKAAGEAMSAPDRDDENRSGSIDEMIQKAQ